MTTTASSRSTALLDGLNHVAIVSRDLDHLAAFYGEVFGVEFEALESPMGRHGFLWVGPATCVHAFEVPETYTGPYPAEDMMRRGRIDHLALGARNETALAEIRRRLVDRGASDGTITCFGRFLSVFFVDPDGMHAEVVCPLVGDVFGPDDYQVHQG
jgi:catechol 2,3-dioxygenase-like lactoylglutathione lyase family enzyme